MAHGRATFLTSGTRQTQLGIGIFIFISVGAVTTLLLDAFFRTDDRVLAFLVAQLVSFFALGLILSGINRKRIMEAAPPGIRQSRFRQFQASIGIIGFLLTAFIIDHIILGIAPGLPVVGQFIIAQVIGLITFELVLRGFGTRTRLIVTG